MGIDRALWEKAVTDVYGPLDTTTDCLTSTEFAALFKIGVTTAKTRLKRLMAAGRAVMVTKLTRDTSGRFHPVTAYRLVDPESQSNSPAPLPVPVRSSELTAPATLESAERLLKYGIARR